nr:MAG TPA: ubiquitin-binding zinc finger protein [Caudoviricetes sp.]
MEDICPWDNDHGYWAKYIKCPACGEKVIIWERSY